ncbi:DegT/DnrJ/EryC1/StrS family aminotransferase [Candidatus Nitrosotenuis cloacae]|uniref:DegT/DnrJ/EryC1/StrS family aminotransferase n=1 Tax=Candidatus Nitrosotenuis cloacae TaxID=1603555 RepID=UPI00227DC80A|nr:DegT/DnrJ/EryC1/StrS family aminotransferase [Candidatus Nitrosotenuis cloacae]
MPEYTIRVGQPYVTEEDAKAMHDAVLGNFLGPGPYVEKFEKEFAGYLGVKDAVAVNSGTSAMLLSLAALNIQSGDEIITTPFTFAATSNVILLNNAKPVFVDIEPETYNIDPNKIVKAITKKTKAIMPIDYGGQSADLIEINEIAEKYDLHVIEDAAPALGATHRDRKVGSISTVAGFSFGPDKHMNTGEGGMITTNDVELAEKCRILRKNGAAKRYYHTYIGWNAKMPDPNAALGSSQLKRIETIVDTKNQLAKYYTEKLDDVSGIHTPIVKDYNRHTFMLYPILAKTPELREKIRSELEKNGVETRINFPPVHLQPVYRQILGTKEGLCPIAEDLAERILGIPIFLKITTEQQDLIINIIKQAAK